MKKERAITLISLVITIILLIILASVAIYLSLGNNGIFVRSKQAKEATNKQQATDIINLKIATAQMNKYANEQRMPTLKELSEILKDDSEIQYVTEKSKKVASVEYDVPSENPSVIYTKLKEFSYEFEIDSSLQLSNVDNVEIPGNSSVTGVFMSITSANYGDAITYSKGGVSDWKVFYKDDNYLYIIVSDYLENSKLPTGLKMGTYSVYGSYWPTSNNFTSIGSSTISTEIANKYGLSWLIDNPTSTKSSARSTADLLDVNAWTERYGDKTRGIEAIGCPTLEMWVNSWNDKGYTPLYFSYCANGYYIGNIENPDTLFVNISDNKDGYEDSLYFPHSAIYENCYGYFLASPSANEADRIYATLYNGSTTGYAYLNISQSTSSYAVRPLVSIPSNLITKDSQGKLAVAQ